MKEEGRELNLEGGEVRRFRGAASALFEKCRGSLLPTTFLEWRTVWG